MGRQVSELSCEDSKRPQDRQACESSAQCGGQWFTGPWSEVSSQPHCRACKHLYGLRIIVCSCLFSKMDLKPLYWNYICAASVLDLLLGLMQIHTYVTIVCLKKIMFWTQSLLFYDCF